VPANEVLERTATPRTKSSRWALMFIIVLLLALAAVGSGWYLSANNSAKAPAMPAVAEPVLPAPALYYALDPQFVVNLTGSTFDSPQYLQIEVQLMTRDAGIHSALAQHAPALRARLLLLFSQQTIETISGREGKERLQAEALNEVRQLIHAETGNDGIEALLFTSFVTQ